ncbi:MAG: inositol monophosphatase family protein [Vicinamibacterales bacterium]
MAAASLQPFLDFAIDAAFQAGRHTLAYFRAGVAVERKADQSPVTVADREAEQILRRLIAARHPDHAVVGEEYGTTGRSSHTWVIDPIDGTQSFIRGVPLYGVMVGLVREGAPVAGAIYFPALDEMVAAARGLGCRANGRPARVSTVSRLADACISSTDGRALAARLGAGWARLAGGVSVVRGWGDCYGHCLVATGRADAMLDPAMHPWDCAALVPILEEAGGRFTGWRGQDGIEMPDAVSSNGELHEELLGYLKDA